MPDFVKPMKVRITFETLDKDGEGFSLYRDYEFEDKEYNDKDWQKEIKGALDVLNSVQNDLPF